MPMNETRDRGGFALEPLAPRRADERIGQHLDRHQPIQASIASPVHLTHPARADQRLDLIGAERAAPREGHRLSSSRTRSMGIASAVPMAERTAVAWKSELYTASSVASSAASNSGDVASVGSTVRARGAVSL